MTEEPEVFGEDDPFTLIHGDDLNEVTRFLTARGIVFTRALSGAALYKLQFAGEKGKRIRGLMRELVGIGARERASRVS